MRRIPKLLLLWLILPLLVRSYSVQRTVRDEFRCSPDGTSVSNDVAYAMSAWASGSGGWISSIKSANCMARFGLSVDPEDLEVSRQNAGGWVNGWLYCPPGCFMHGVSREPGSRTIECRKPARAPNHFGGNCAIHHFNSPTFPMPAGTVRFRGCKPGSFITSINHGPATNVGKVRCCPLAPFCGNGKTDAGEECDDGNLNDHDSCTSECQHARCGDGYIQPGEFCDNGDPEEHLTSECFYCRKAKCGDGFLGKRWDDTQLVDLPEDCDSDDRSQCTADCQHVFQLESTEVSHIGSGNERYYTLMFQAHTAAPSLLHTRKNVEWATLHVEVETGDGAYIPFGASQVPGVFPMTDSEPGNNWMVTVENFRPVDKYRYWVEYKTSFFPPSRLPSTDGFNEIDLSCGCFGSGEGAPELRVTQRHGTVFYQWIDESLCEDEFVVYRDDSIIDGFRFRGKKPCGEQFDVPSRLSITMDPEEYLLSEMYTYCIQAVNHAEQYATAGPMPNSRHCASFTPAWTSTIQGSVQTPSGFAVTDIEILIRSKDDPKSEFATVVNSIGEYKVPLQLPAKPHRVDEQAFVVTPHYAGASVKTCQQLGWTHYSKFRESCFDPSMNEHNEPSLRVDYLTAAVQCRSKGARLCTAEELFVDHPVDSGCYLFGPSLCPSMAGNCERNVNWRNGVWEKDAWGMNPHHENSRANKTACLLVRTAQVNGNCGTNDAVAYWNANGQPSVPRWTNSRGPCASNEMQVLSSDEPEPCLPRDGLAFAYCCADVSPFRHTFSVDGNDIPHGKEIIIEHIQTAALEIVDNSVGTLTGAVYYEELGCEVPDDRVQVCAFLAEDHKAVLCAAVVGGKYSLAVPLNLDVYVKPLWDEASEYPHMEFEAQDAALESRSSVTAQGDRFVLTVTGLANGMDFADVTHSDLTVTVRAGSEECNKFLFPATVAIRPKCNMEMNYGNQIDLTTTRSGTISLPSVVFEIELLFDDVGAGPYQRYVLEEIKPYFTNLQQNLVIVDLETTNSTSAEFAFYSKGEVEVYTPLTLNPTNYDCWTTEAVADPDYPGYLKQHVTILQQGAVYNLTVAVREYYKVLNGEGTALIGEYCDVVDNRVRVIDPISFGESECHDSKGGCIRQLRHGRVSKWESVGGSGYTMTEEFRSTTEITVHPKSPNVNGDHVQRLEILYQRTGHSTVKLNAIIGVEGDQMGSAFHSIKVPPYVPLLILHDPPGGNSYAAMTQESSFSSLWKLSLDRGMAREQRDGGGVTVNQQTDAEVGFLSLLSGMDVFAMEGALYLKAGPGYENNNDDEQSLEMNLRVQHSYRTSDDPSGGVGSDADMFLVPGLSIRMVQTESVFFSETACKLELSESYKWHFNESSPGSTPNTLMWYSQYDIKNVVIPALEVQKECMRNPDSECKPEPNLSEDERERRLNLVTDAIVGWTSTLELNYGLNSPSERFPTLADLGHRLLKSEACEDFIAALDAELFSANSAIGDVAATRAQGEPKTVLKTASGFAIAGRSGSPLSVADSMYVGWLAMAASVTGRDRPVDNEVKQRYSIENSDVLSARDLTGSAGTFPSVVASVLKQPRIRDLATEALDSLPGGIDYSKSADALREFERMNISNYVLADAGTHRQDVSDVGMISFVGGGSAYEYTFSGTSSMEHSFTFSAQNSLVVDGSVEYAARYFGFGLGMEGSANAEWRLTKTVGRSGKHESSSVVSFVLQDPEPGDAFDVHIAVDPVYGTPLFHTISGQSSCVWENNTLTRMNPSLSFDRRSTSFSVEKLNPYETAYVTLTVGNNADTKESAEFYIILDDHSNPDGLELSVDGRKLGTVTTSYLPSESTDYQLAIKRGPNAYTYSEVILSVVPKCEYDLTYVSPYHTATGRLNVSFARPCPPVDWAGSALADGSWTINTASADARVTLQVRNPDHKTNPWNQTGNRLERVTVQFRDVELEGAGGWTNVFDPETKDHLDLLLLPSSENGYVTYTWDVELPDGQYSVRVLDTCSFDGDLEDASFNFASTEPIRLSVDRSPPQVLKAVLQPQSRVLTPEDGITVTFSEPICCSSATNSLQVNIIEDNVDLTAGTATLCDRETVVIDVGQDAFKANYSGDRLVVTFGTIVDLAGNQFPGELQLDFHISAAAWECTVPSSCDASGVVTCDYPDVNHVCESCKVGWFGSGCTCKRPPHCDTSGEMQCSLNGDVLCAKCKPGYCGDDCTRVSC